MAGLAGFGVGTSVLTFTSALSEGVTQGSVGVTVLGLGVVDLLGAEAFDAGVPDLGLMSFGVVVDLESEASLGVVALFCSFGVLALTTATLGVVTVTLGSGVLVFAEADFGVETFGWSGGFAFADVVGVTSATGLCFTIWAPTGPVCFTTGSSVSIGEGISSSSSIFELDPEATPAVKQIKTNLETSST